MVCRPTILESSLNTSKLISKLQPANMHLFCLMLCYYSYFLINPPSPLHTTLYLTSKVPNSPPTGHPRPPKRPIVPHKGSRSKVSEYLTHLFLFKLDFDFAGQWSPLASRSITWMVLLVPGPFPTIYDVIMRLLQSYRSKGKGQENKKVHLLYFVYFFSLSFYLDKLFFEPQLQFVLGPPSSFSRMERRLFYPDLWVRWLRTWYEVSSSFSISAQTSDIGLTNRSKIKYLIGLYHETGPGL